jgi:hypothetical protein
LGVGDVLLKKRDVEGGETVYKGNSGLVINDASRGGDFLNADTVVLRKVLKIFALDDLQLPEARKKQGEGHNQDDVGIDKVRAFFLGSGFIQLHTHI